MISNVFTLPVKSNYRNKYSVFMSPHIYKVVDAMAHAVMSTRPRLRYMVGWDHKIFWGPLSLLPSEVQDLVLKTPEGITGRN